MFSNPIGCVQRNTQISVKLFSQSSKAHLKDIKAVFLRYKEEHAALKTSFYFSLFREAGEAPALPFVPAAE